MRPWAHGFYALQIVTHKVLRRLLGVPLTVLLASNIVLAGSATSYAATLATQACVYALAALGFALKGSQVGRSPLLALPLYFVMVNVAGLVAASNAIRGRRVDIWEAGR